MLKKSSPFSNYLGELGVLLDDHGALGGLNMSDTLAFTEELIARASVTPEDAGCQEAIIRRLTPLGFETTRLRFEDVDNLWITHGSSKPIFCFAGHTDVVPAGPLDKWTSDPFQAVIREGYLYGRGAADMKSGIAAMTLAAGAFVKSYPEHPGTLALLITSDEEGPSINGTRRVINYLNQEKIKIDWCVVAEPSSDKQLGDVIRTGRRGSLNARLTIKGIQGHVAYPDLADNPVHRVSPFLSEITQLKWDQGNEEFPPTTFQISNIHAGNGAENVIPGNVELLFNFRFSTETTEAKITQTVTKLLEKHALDYEINWILCGLPFLTQSGRLITATQHAIQEECNIKTECSTGGGTSDGRFIAPTGAEVIELGVVNASIHKINECVRVAELDTLQKLYQRIVEQLLLTGASET